MSGVVANNNMMTTNGGYAGKVADTSQGNITAYYRASNPFMKNQLPTNNSYLSNYPPQPPRVNDWVGDYKPQPPSQRNMHELA